jgi:hypothetical protein
MVTQISLLLDWHSKHCRLWSSSSIFVHSFVSHPSSELYTMTRSLHRKDLARSGMKTVVNNIDNSDYSDTTVKANSPQSDPSNINVTISSSETHTPEIDVSKISEAQVLLACRSWLLRKHKIDWKEKKRRSEAASSPLNNEGYFWPDPNDLLYLREDPDPYDLNYNETYGEYYGYKRNGVRFLQSTGDTTYSGKNYYETELPVVEERESTSKNPFSANPLYPSEEFERRSMAKIQLFNNETWKEEWYNRRWRGKVATPLQKTHDHEERLLRDIPNDILDSPSFDSMSEAEVSQAIRTHMNANYRKSESRRGNKDKRQIEREEFREWREQVKRDALNATGIITKSVLTATIKDDELSFSPSVDAMIQLKRRRSDKSKRAFQTRITNTKAVLSTSTSVKITQLPRGSSEHNVRHDKNDRYSIDTEYLDKLDEVTSPMQAILHIDMALDHNLRPSPEHVEMILKPGRLGRRRETLRRILSECFGLRGKCVPDPDASDSGGDESLSFVTKCGIDELGAFVISKLKQ